MTRELPYGKPLYVLKHVKDFGLDVDWVPGFHPPVQLSLTAEAGQLIGVDLETHQQGANLAIHMEKEAALQLFSEIRALAQTMGWKLPTEDEDRA